MEFPVRPVKSFYHAQEFPLVLLSGGFVRYLNALHYPTQQPNLRQQMNKAEET